MIIGFFITFLVGLLCPIYFLLGILAPICFPWVSSAIFLHSHEFLLTPLSFPGLIILSFILGAHGHSISPLLSLLALLRACCGPLSLFYITYCLWVCYFSLSKLLQTRLLPHGPFVYFMGLAITHYSCHLGLKVFFLSTH